MRRLSVALALITLAFPGCRIRKKPQEAKAAVAAPTDDGQLTSVVNAGDPLRAVQFVRGFYGIENQSWRWTAKNFAVTLGSPKGSGANLEMKFVIPDVMFNRVGAMTVDAKANGLDLGSETFSTAGEATYTREIPAVVLARDSTTFEFSVDKGLPPSVKDPRELALIVSSVGLVPKVPK